MMKTLYTLPIPAVNSPADLFEKFFTKWTAQSRTHRRSGRSRPQMGRSSGPQDVTTIRNLSVVGQTLRKID